MQRLFFLIIFTSFILLAITISGINRPTKTPSPTSLVSQNKPIANQTIRTIAKNIFENCQNLQSECYENAIKNQLLDVYPVSEILISIQDYDTYFSCHAFTHFLGRALYQKLQSIPDAYFQIDFTCHGGSYHGVIESYLDQKKIKPEKITGIEIQTICQNSKELITKNHAQVYTECLHGFGHAFMFITNSDLPLSLFYCDKLATLEDKEKCYGGAFMENSTSSTNADHPSDWIRTNDKFYPCSILDQKYLNQCYFYQANYLVKITGHNYQSVFADCDLLSGNHRIQCILGLGANLTSLSNEAGVEKAASICDLGQNDARKICIEGAIPSMMARWGDEPERIIEFCQEVTFDLKKLCFVNLGLHLKEWGYNQNEQDSICSLAQSFKKTCLGNSIHQSKILK